MNIKTKVAAGIAAAGLAAGIGLASTSGSADASTTQLQTSNKTETIVSAKCYTYRQVTTTYYYYSSTHGWTRYPTPRVTTTTGETCHA